MLGKVSNYGCKISAAECKGVFWRPRKFECKFLRPRMKCLEKYLSMDAKYVWQNTKLYFGCRKSLNESSLDAR